MKKAVIFLISLFSIIICKANYDIVKKALEFVNGNEYFIAKDKDEKVGVIDKNENVIIPFLYDNGDVIIKDRSAAFVMKFPYKEKKGCEMYDIMGNKVVDSSKGYESIHSNWGPGLLYEYPSETILLPDEMKFGLLDIWGNNLSEPNYNEYEFFALGNAYLIFGKKYSWDDVAVGTNSVLLAANYEAYTNNINDGRLMWLENLKECDSSGNIIDNSNVLIKLCTMLPSKEKVDRKDEFYPTPGLYWNIFDSNGLDTICSYNYVLMPGKFKITKTDSALVLNEIDEKGNIGESFISFQNINNTPIITFDIIGNKRYFTLKRKDAQAAVVDELSSFMGLGGGNGLNEADESNYSKNWIKQFISVIEEL